MMWCVWYDVILHNPRHVVYQLLPPKKDLDITCGNVLITFLCLSPIIIWSGRIFCTECYLWIPTRCMCKNCVCVSLPTGVCMYIATYCIVYTLFVGSFTKLISIFVLILMLLSLSAFVRFLIKKLLACLTDNTTKSNSKAVFKINRILNTCIKFQQ